MYFATKQSFKVDESVKTMRSVKQNSHECYKANMPTSPILDFPNVELYIVKLNLPFANNAYCDIAGSQHSVLYRP